jgi:hypothetical protein
MGSRVSRSQDPSLQEFPETAIPHNRDAKTKWSREHVRLAGNTGVHSARHLKRTHLIYAASMGPVTHGSSADGTLAYNELGQSLKLPDADLLGWEGCLAAKYSVIRYGKSRSLLEIFY